MYVCMLCSQKNSTPPPSSEKSGKGGGVLAVCRLWIRLWTGSTLKRERERDRERERERWTDRQMHTYTDRHTDRQRFFNIWVIIYILTYHIVVSSASYMQNELYVGIQHNQVNNNMCLTCIYVCNMICLAWEIVMVLVNIIMLHVLMT